MTVETHWIWQANGSLGTERTYHTKRENLENRKIIESKSARQTVGKGLGEILVPRKGILGLKLWEPLFFTPDEDCLVFFHQNGLVDGISIELFLDESMISLQKIVHGES